jgi:hypothetical protein
MTRLRTSRGRVVIAACCLYLALGAASARAADYSADRFDVRIEVLRGGTLRVVETVVFRFGDRSFTQVSREIRSRRTDGLEIVSAAMDGVPFPRGRGPGQVEVTGTSRPRIRWHFAAEAGSIHTFELTYLARGVVQQDGGADLTAWRALPTEHDYRIASSTIDIDLLTRPSAEPSIERRRVETASTRVEDTHVRITATNIGPNGWIEASVRQPAGAVLGAPPLWQQRELEVRRLIPLWLALAGVVAFGGLVMILAVRQSYDSPPKEIPSDAPVAAPPDSLAPAMAGALVANGRPQIEHAMAALFTLAQRGSLTITEQPRTFGQRAFVVTRRRLSDPEAPYEAAALSAIFDARRETDPAVTLNKARSRLTLHFGDFKRALTHELAAAGLIDEGRRAIRRRFLQIGAWALVASGVAALIGILFVRSYGAWHMLVPLALLLVGLTALIFYGTHTALSNDGVRRREQWLRFRQTLRNVARDRSTVKVRATPLLLPFAVTLGLAEVWAKYLKHHREAVPAWFQALSSEDGTGAFAALVASGGSGDGSAGASAGAAGGGSSSAS